jgi:hypothetical protein
MGMAPDTLAVTTLDKVSRNKPMTVLPGIKW